MSRRVCSRLVVTGAFLVSFVCLASAVRAEKVAPAKSKDDAKAGDKAKDDKADKADKADPASSDDSLKIPDTKKPEELLAYIEKVQKTRPKVKSREALIEFLKQSRTSLLEAADKLLAMDPEPKLKAKAYMAKLDALSLLAQVSPDGDFDKQRDKLLDELKSAKDPAISRIYRQMKLFEDMQQIPPGDVAEGKQAWDRMKKLFAEDPDSELSSQLAMMLTQRLEMYDRDPEKKLAVQVYSDYKDLLSKSKLEANKKQAEKVDGVIRRITLLGKKLDIKGKTLDGKTFDTDSLKGKVVLLDFWATWCGPCVAELPNVKANYKKYHDKGFEVVGVSLDDDEDALRGFIKDREVAWPILFDPKEKGFETPLANYYGIGAIPTVILTNQKGEVVSLNARGPILGDELAKLLGDDDKKDSKAGDKPEKPGVEKE